MRSAFSFFATFFTPVELTPMRSDFGVQVTVLELSALRLDVPANTARNCTARDAVRLTFTDFVFFLVAVPIVVQAFVPLRRVCNTTGAPPTWPDAVVRRTETSLLPPTYGVLVTAMRAVDVFGPEAVGAVA